MGEREKDRLCCILRIMCVSQDALADRHHHGAMTTDNLVEALLILVKGEPGEVVLIRW